MDTESGLHTYRLTEHEAFAAMSVFLHEFADRAGNDLLTLLGDITLDGDGRTFDQAAWEDWLRSIETVVGDPSD